MQLIAESNDLLIDFRTPRGLGPRKRYVTLTRSPEVMRRVVTHFGYVPHPPSEKDAVDPDDTDDPNDGV